MCLTSLVRQEEEGGFASSCNKTVRMDRRDSSSGRGMGRWRPNLRLRAVSRLDRWLVHAITVTGRERSVPAPSK